MLLKIVYHAGAQGRLKISPIFIITATVLMLRASANAATIPLFPGDNIQVAVNANPGGTTFSLAPGTYRMQTVVPRTGDVFTGQLGADLNGSQVITNWTHSGSYWTSAGHPELSTQVAGGEKWCGDKTTGCAYSQDLFLNNNPLVHKLSLPIHSGQWYFDYPHDIIYMADNPAGHTVELSVAQLAFSGYVSNVTIQGLTIEKYAAPLFSGAIAPFGANWTIKLDEIRLNHGAGIKTQFNAGDYVQILSNNVHHNGQQGIGIGGGVGVLIEFNTSANNNYLGTILEDGGGKVSGTIAARVLNNTYSQNNGPGIWFNGGGSADVIQGNIVTLSFEAGIRIEISGNETVSDNTLINNGQSLTGKCTVNSHEIELASSNNSTVSGNTITTNCGCIWITSGTRNHAVNNSVLGNTIIYAGLTPLRHVCGGSDSTGTLDMFSPAANNFYDFNTYQFPISLITKDNWNWDNELKNFLGWQAAGEDTHGLAD